METDATKRQLTGSDSEGSSLDDSSPKYKRRKLEKGSDEYVQRRERNNLAVKKSREKSRQKAKETMEQVDKLRKENATLEQKVTILSKELGVLKDLFLAHAGTVSQEECPSNTSKSEVVDHGYSSSVSS